MKETLPTRGERVTITWLLNNPLETQHLPAVYEGERPYRLVLVSNGEVEMREQIPLAVDLSGRIVAHFGEKRQVFYHAPDGRPLPERGNYFYVLDNPRFRLADGSFVWGAECRWDRVPSMGHA